MMTLDSLCQQVGEERLRAMVAAFYRRVRVDDLIGPMYPAEDWEGSEKRLADFVIYRFGGPPTYLEQRGHPRLRMRLTLMGEAMRETGITEEEAQVMIPFFAQVADMMRNRPE
jgi:hemoglobin